MYKPSLHICSHIFAYKHVPGFTVMRGYLHHFPPEVTILIIYYNFLRRRCFQEMKTNILKTNMADNIPSIKSW